MLLPTKLQCLLALLYFTQAHSRLIPQIESFSKELIYHDKGIHLSETQAVVTENESFLYAICSSQEKTFRENHCNVTIETPAFANASYRQTCEVKIVPDNVKLESLHKLRLYTFGEERAMLTWAVKDLDFRTKVSKVRILEFSNCKTHDVSVPVDKILTIVPNDGSFDVITTTEKKYCGADHCRVTYDSQGKKIAGPVQFMQNFKFAFLTAIVPAIPRVAKEFFVLAYSNNEECHALQVKADGKANELLKVHDPSYIRMSNSRDLFSVCYASEKTNVTCKQYDAKMAAKTNAVVEFRRDEAGIGTVRWFQPHNLVEGGLLLVTGYSNDSRTYDGFSVMKINQDGRHERPLEVDGLGFECTNKSRFFVNVAENDADQLCLHFVCNRLDFDQKYGNMNTLKFSTKCLHKGHASMMKYRAAVN